MEWSTGVTERDVAVSASITFQREGRAGEAALQQWRKEILRNEKLDVDLTQGFLFEGIQEWARQHHSDERAASKSRRVTLKAGKIVQGSQKSPPVKLPQVAGIPPYTFWTLAVRNFKPVHEGDKLCLVYGDDGEVKTHLPDDDEDDAQKEEGGQGPPAHAFSQLEDHQVLATCQRYGAGAVVLRTLARLLLHASDDEGPSEEEEKLIGARYKWLLTAPPLRLHKYIPSWNAGGTTLRQPGQNAYTGASSPSRGTGVCAANSPMANAGLAQAWEPSDITSGLSTFEDVFCRRCYVHDCHLHGVKDKSDPCLDSSANQRPAAPPCAAGQDMREPCSATCCASSRAMGVDRTEAEQDAGRAGAEMRTDGATGMGRTGGGASVEGDAHGEGREWTRVLDTRGGVAEKQGADSSGEAWSNTSRKQERGEGGVKPPAPPFDARAGPSLADAEGWTRFQVGLFEQGVRMYGAHQGSACRIARLLQPARTCAEVAHRLKRLQPAAAEAEAEKKERRKRAKHNKKVNVLHMLARKRNAGKHREDDLPGAHADKLAAYTPCACTGGCDAGGDAQCPCAAALTPCEKFCACLQDCPLKQGLFCRCTAKCTNGTCPCVAGGRECDPDLCKGCMVSCGDPSSAAAHLGGPNPHRADAPGARLDQCGNMRLQQRRHKKILLGPSDVAGWGAFICGGAAAGELLGEYTGELVTDREAEQRGKFYDANNKSFLFTLNDQLILDACHRGDKLKFANHKPSANCEPRVVSVLGDHRVAIHAKCHLESGDEIFYNYGYNEYMAPDWANTEADRQRREQGAQQMRKAARKGTKR